MRMTLSMVSVLELFLASPDTNWWGYELLKQSGVKRSTLYTVLTRLQEEGWIRGWWEEIDEQAAGRPARRYYCITAEGQRDAPRAIADALGPALSYRARLGTA